MRFNGAYLDHNQTQAGQFGWAYLLYLLRRYGQHWQNTDFYAAKLLTAFPRLGEPIESDQLPGRSLEFERVYRWRFTEQFGLWFDLLALQKERPRGVIPIRCYYRQHQYSIKSFCL